MPRFVSILFVLWLCLSCTGGTRAAAQGRFTAEEQACRIGGELVAAIGIARDVYTPLTDVIRNLRQEVPKRYKGFAQTRMAFITETFVDLAKTIYFAPSLSPHVLRRGFETGCLNPDKVNQQWLRQE